MRLVIVHKGSSSYVSLFFRDALEARRARDKGFRDAQEKRSRVILFGPDLLGQDVKIHEDCIASTSVLRGDPDDAAPPKPAATKPVVKEPPMIIPAGVVPVPLDTPFRTEDERKPS